MGIGSRHDSPALKDTTQVHLISHRGRLPRDPNLWPVVLRNCINWPNSGFRTSPLPEQPSWKHEYRRQYSRFNCAVTGTVTPWVRDTYFDLLHTTTYRPAQHSNAASLYFGPSTLHLSNSNFHMWRLKQFRSFNAHLIRYQEHIHWNSMDL